MTVASILIVDDNPTNLFVLRLMLRKLGYDVLEAVGGEASVDLALQHRPRLVLMDLRMPGMDGMAAAESIRTQLGEHAPIIVAVTASVTPEQRQACAASGFAGLIPKPVDFSELAGFVSRYAA